MAARKKGYEIKDVRQQALVHLWEQIQWGKTAAVATIASRLAKTPKYRNEQEVSLNPNIKVQAAQERDYLALAEEVLHIFKLRHSRPKQRNIAKMILEGYGTVEITKESSISQPEVLRVRKRLAEILLGHDMVSYSRIHEIQMAQGRKSEDRTLNRAVRFFQVSSKLPEDKKRKLVSIIESEHYGKDAETSKLLKLLVEGKTIDEIVEKGVYKNRTGADGVQIGARRIITNIMPHLMQALYRSPSRKEFLLQKKR